MKTVLLAAVCVAVLGSTSLVAHAEILGAQETVKILGDDPITVTAVLDPKAPHARLIVESFKYIPRLKGLDVSFVVDNGAIVHSKQVTLQRPVLQDILVKDKDGGVSHIPVVPMNICIGETRLEVDFKLYKRDNYKTTMTLGAQETKRLIKHGNILDPTRSFIQTPDCDASLARY